MNETKTHGYKLASKGKRLIATLTEGIIFGIIILGIYLIMGKSVSEFWTDLDSDFEFLDIVYSLVTGIIIGAIFYPIFTGNLGHRIFNIKVISEETGEDYKKPEKEGEIENPDSGSISSCWTLSKSVTSYFPSYCYTCADFNGDGRVDGEDLKIFLSLLGGSTKDRELVGDFNGDGKVDNKDLSSFLGCMRENNLNITDFCGDKEVFCVLCKQLGSLSPCNGDCLKCI